MTNFVIKLSGMKKFITILTDLRTLNQSSKKELATFLNVDASLISRFESGERLPTKQQVEQIASFYRVKPSDLLISWLGEKIYREVEDEDFALEALQVAESRISYAKPKVLEIDNLLKDIDSLKAKLDSHRPLSGTHLKKLEDYYKIDYTFESNRIEGNTLSLQETALVVEKGITISGKSVREHLEAINHADAVDFLMELAQKKTPLTEFVIKQIHGLVLRGIDRENAGRYRMVNVRISGSKHIPPEPYMLNKLMEDYILFYESEKDRMHPVLLAAEIHERLVTIHPFIDGNGRTSRLAMNLVLLQNGYPIANISGNRENRLKYYAALEKAQTHSNKSDFHQFVSTAVQDSLRDYLKMV